jgi:polar amino acid transport system substrate-binding protein
MKFSFFAQRRLAMTFVAGLAFFGSAVQAQNALDDVLKTKTIKIAIPTDYPPYGFVGIDLQPQGLDIEMANYIGQKLGVKVELIPVISANRIPYLQTKKADLVISTLGKNAEREKVIDFTSAIPHFSKLCLPPKTSTSRASMTWLANRWV